jgi:hypothetical protein
VTRLPHRGTVVAPTDPVCWPHGRRSGESEIHFIALNPSPGMKVAGLGFVLLTPCLPVRYLRPIAEDASTEPVPMKLWSTPRFMVRACRTHRTKRQGP